jgi:dissimilatory sulfite reductase (desulfoviridin) alpha/beta subunit
LAEIDYATLKKGGFMRQRQKNRFSLRLRVIGGQLTAEKLAKISEIADRYGHGYIHLTARQGVEIPFIDFDDIEEIKGELATVGLAPGACGPRVRTVTACQGASICPSGLIETSELAEEVDARYFGRELPHKFKIGVTGCKNNCLKAEENDIGIKGGMLPSWEAALCTFCGLCTAVCPTDAIEKAGIDGRQTLRLKEDACIFCGKCAKSCPTDAWTGRSGYLLSFGGTFGNNLFFGIPLLPILFEKKELFAAIDAAIAFFDEHGKAGERFVKTVERAGWDALRNQLADSVQGAANG